MIDDLAKLLKAIAHPIRLKILILCAQKEQTSRELREALNISKPLLIAHLHKLTEAGFLEHRAEVDEKKMIIKKYYKTTNFTVHIDANFLKKIPYK